ncbi:MAG: transposase, partial [Phycisphaerales bacterium]|nr:transposase [Phycisphaerales bacterium]
LLPPRSPNLNAFAERLIQSIKRECLDRFVILGLCHLDHLLAEYTDYHNRQRPHSSIGFRAPTGPPPVVHASAPHAGRVRCQERLGGVIRHYYRKAA